MRGARLADLLPHSLIDAHCHLDDFDEPLAVLERARAAGVKRVIANGLWRGSKERFGPALALAESYPDRVSATVGIHPHDAAEVTPEVEAEASALAERSAIVAIGETGLDYHYDHSPREQQRERFRWHIALARRVKKPLVLHVREADEAAAQLLREERAHELGGQVHCFSAGEHAARRYLDLGFHLSFSGVLTFKTAEELRGAARYTPLDRLLVETDSPYLAPVPFRGKRCEPAYVVETAKLLAKLHDLPFETIARLTTENAERLFSLS